jgi:hypothetical protein
MTEMSHYDAWYQATQIYFDSQHPNKIDDSGLTPAQTGALALSASYAVAGALLYTKNPYAVATAGVILAIPDPVIVGFGMLLA